MSSMKTPWRSLDECHLEGRVSPSDEFPAGFENNLERRQFVRLLGASAAMLALGSCRRPVAHLVPFSHAVEWSLPGKFLYYATSMPSAAGANPLLVATVDGRPIKVESNPLHPATGRGSSAFAQASVAELYHPARIRSISCGGKAASAEDFRDFLSRVRSKYQKTGEGLAVLVSGEISPTQERLRQQLAADFPGMLWAVYEPIEHEWAAGLALQEGEALLPRFERADIVVSLDSDFLNPAEVPIGVSRGFYSRRNPDQRTAPMNRLYVAESYLSLTGGMADHRLRVKASEIGGVLLALAQAVAAQVPNSMLSSALRACPPLPGSPDPRWIAACVQDLISNEGRTVVWVGASQPPHVQALALVLNRALGNLNSTIEIVDRKAKKAADISSLATAMHRREVRHLFLLGGNPAYDAPAELNFSSLLAQVPETCHLSLFFNETSRLSRWQVPAAHFLESWGDTCAFDGTLSAIQPMILPLWNGWSGLRVLSALAGEDSTDSPIAVRKTFLEQNNEEEWREFLRVGFLKNSAWSVISGEVNSSSVMRILREARPPRSSDTELVFLRSSNVNDGRFAENAWLQEMPDFITKIVWDNAALLSPTTAARLGVQDGDILEISSNSASSRSAFVRAAALLAPSHAEDSIAIALGYGRQVPDISIAASENAQRFLVGFNAYPLRQSDSIRFHCGVRVFRRGEKHRFAQTQENHTIYEENLVRQANLNDYQHALPNSPPQTFPKGPSPQWAMAVDLSTCIGCNACLVACQAENNVPVVGKEEVRRGRDMAWIRIDRYFVGDPTTAEVLPQMIACQHCENAPCEPVCPVNATVHNEEGLNLMVYNRCIGTRYCSNNCPWKVRRFNFFDYNERPLNQADPSSPKGMAESMKLSKNPNVTVRMRGVMEKCTFCIQRIEEAKISRLVRAGPSDPEKLPLPSFQTACQQACPAEAIVFGNEADENSWVARLRLSPRGYTLLDTLNTRPRVTYLTRIRNPHNELPPCI
ncbi:MAG: molybdopterin oxidoreductase [Verrucomicrobia bacterium]|nr:MAG: molybdopterin oxidoreductase [Verrucomicrobiota bacterium]